ncbi:phosphopantetheine-binding protein [Flavobacteriaceae bacterium]|nr:phosphopantetheine-binding protein [Flavobacteriaceae bacterium]
MDNRKELLKIINEVNNGIGNPILVSISDSDKLREDLGLSSFDLAELTVRIEDKYDIDIFEDGVVYTVKEILDIIENK